MLHRDTGGAIEEENHCQPVVRPEDPRLRKRHDEQDNNDDAQDKTATPPIGQRLTRRLVQTNRDREVAGVLGAEHTVTAHPHAGRRGGADRRLIRQW